MNPYSSPLSEFYENVARYQLLSFHFKNQITDTFDKFSEIIPGGPLTVSGLALIIRDWSEVIPDGWARNYHTGTWASITRDRYAEISNEMLSSIFLHSFAQAYELLTRYMKDLVMIKGTSDPSILEYTRKGTQQTHTRSTLPSGIELYEILAKPLGLKPNSTVKYVTLPANLKDLWTVISEVRHAITHSQGLIRPSKVHLSGGHSYLFNTLFPKSASGEDSIQIFLDYDDLAKAIKTIGEFAFQLYKAASISEGLDWKSFIDPAPANQ